MGPRTNPRKARLNLKTKVSQRAHPTCPTAVYSWAMPLIVLRTHTGEKQDKPGQGKRKNRAEADKEGAQEKAEDDSPKVHQGQFFTRSLARQRAS